MSKNKFDDVLKMGHMKTWWIFGFEHWGDFKPAQMTTPDGRVFVPLFAGLWIRKGKVTK